MNRPGRNQNNFVKLNNITEHLARFDRSISGTKLYYLIEYPSGSCLVKRKTRKI